MSKMKHWLAFCRGTRPWEYFGWHKKVSFYRIWEAVDWCRTSSNVMKVREQKNAWVMRKNWVVVNSLSLIIDVHHNCVFFLTDRCLAFTCILSNLCTISSHSINCLLWSWMIFLLWQAKCIEHAHQKWTHILNPLTKTLRVSGLHHVSTIDNVTAPLS